MNTNEPVSFLGRQVDNYEIIELITSRVVSNLYLAQDLDSGRPFFLEVLHSYISRNSNLASQFQQRMQAVAQLYHPGIARVREVVASSTNLIYAAIEYVPGRSLAEMLRELDEREITLSTREALLFVRQIASALVLAHSRDVVHHDLRPKNIIVEDDFKPVLIDLGVPAVANISATMSIRKGFGPPYYVPPEHLRGKKGTPQGNIYSLGVILHELLVGYKPEIPSSNWRILGYTVSITPTEVALEALRPGLSPETYYLVNKCLQKREDRRFQSMEQVVEAIDTSLEAERLDRLPAVAPNQRRRRGCAAVIISLLALLLLLLWYGSNHARTQAESADGGPVANVDVTPVTGAQQDSVDTPVVSSTLVATPPSPVSPSMTTVPAEGATPTLAPTVTLSQPSLIEALPAGSGEVAAERLPDVPAIDGDLLEWTGTPSYRSDYRVYSASAWDGTDDLAAVWHLAWDEVNLYIAVEVTDDTHVQTQSGSQIFRGDSVEIQIDTDRAGDYGASVSPDDFQVILSPGDFAGLGPAAFRYRGANDGQLVEAPGYNITVAAWKTDKGYNLEAAIPWLDLMLTPAPGMIMGLALNANDNDTPGTAVQEVMKSHVPGRTLRDPTSWGTLTLK